MKNAFEQTYNRLTLPEMTDQLQQGRYHSIEYLCETAKKQCKKVETLELSEKTSPYTALCNLLIEQILVSIKKRKEHFIPYIQELSEKEANEHDCANCSGNCKINHDLALREIKAIHKDTENILHRMQMLSLPLYAETTNVDAYRILRDQMAIIETDLGELFFIEESFLIPKIVEAQKNIHAAIR